MRKLTFVLVALTGLVLATVVYYWLSCARPIPEAVAAPLPPSIQRSIALAPFLPPAWDIAESKEERLERIHLPFLHKKLVGKQVTVAVIRGDGIEFKGERTSRKNTMLTDGKVTVLAGTGQLLRAELYSPKHPGPFPGQGTVEESEDQYRRMSETYEALPEEKPNLSLQEVLSCVYRESMAGSPQDAKRIEISFVMNSRKGIREAKAIWVISFFGMSPCPTFGPGSETISAESRSYLRYVVEANGKVLSADNQP